VEILEGGLNRAFAVMEGNIDILDFCKITKIVIIAITPDAFQ